MAVKDIIKKLIPLLELSPLRAKKKRDFTIWRQAVTLMSAVQSEPTTSDGLRFYPKWTPDRVEVFSKFHSDLKKTRAYKSGKGLPLKTEKGDGE